MITYQGTGYTVYKHTNKVNGKVYIGLTKCKDLKRRWAGGHGYKECKFFFSAIVRYGWLNFEHEILETGLTKEEAADREQFYVKEYRARNPKYGYNIQEGGFNSSQFSKQGYKNAVANFKGHASCPVVIFNTTGKRIKDFSDMTGAAKFLGCGIPAVSSACSRGRGTCRGYIVRYAEEVIGVDQLPDDEIFKPHAQPGCHVPIAMYDLNGNFIRSFGSIAEAAETVGATGPAISSCVDPNRSQRSTKGFMWSKKVDGEFPTSIAPYQKKKSGPPPNVIPVCQYDRFTGKKMATYPSYTAAAKAAHCKIDSIRNNVLGLTKTAAGYIWNLESDGIEEVVPIPIRGGRWDREPA